MHIVFGLIALLSVLAIWWWRIKMMREAGSEVLDAASDVRATVRRLMYKRKHDVHPADSVDDPRLAASGIVVAVATMDAPISQAEIEALTRNAQETFDVTHREALDIVSFGRWVADQCNTNGEAVRRLSKIVAQKAGADAATDLVRMIEDVATAGGHELGEDERDAIATVHRTLGTA